MPSYNSLIGKLIVHGEDRPAALARLNRALAEFVVEGVDTTAPLFLDLLRNRDIMTGDYSIHWLETWLKTR
jgi:acetyl-CoA carboxylase biotin carboxylase subunit